MAVANASTTSGSISNLTAGYVRPATAATPRSLGPRWTETREHPAQQERPQRGPCLHHRGPTARCDVRWRVGRDHETFGQGADRFGRLGEGPLQTPADLQRSLARPAFSAGETGEGKGSPPHTHHGARAKMPRHRDQEE